MNVRILFQTHLGHLHWSMTLPFVCFLASLMFLVCMMPVCNASCCLPWGLHCRWCSMHSNLCRLICHPWFLDKIIWSDSILLNLCVCVCVWDIWVLFLLSLEGNAEKPSGNEPSKIKIQHTCTPASQVVHSLNTMGVVQCCQDWENWANMPLWSSHS